MNTDPNTRTYPTELTQRHVGDEYQDAVRWVGDHAPPTDPVVIVDPDPNWPVQYASASAELVGVLGETIVCIEHVGSTSVPGLPAKPIIDIDLQVRDSSSENTYAPALEAAGYRHVLREPWWNGHRMFLGNNGGINLHVFQEGTPEPLRHLLFRDWLRTHKRDREMYAEAKRRLAVSTADNPDSYNLDKNSVIDDIFTRIFTAPPQTHPAWPSAGWTPTGDR